MSVAKNPNHIPIPLYLMVKSATNNNINNIYIYIPISKMVKCAEIDLTMNTYQAN